MTKLQLLWLALTQKVQTNSIFVKKKIIIVKDTPVYGLFFIVHVLQNEFMILFLAIDPQTPQLKLSYGNRLNEGHVEVNVRGTWGSLCAGNLTEAEARVICRLRGYRDGVALHGGSFGQNFPVGYSTMDYIKCSGDEQRLLDCVVSLVPDQVVCPRNMMSAVKCYETGMCRI